MRVVRPGPERDAFIQRIRERWVADEAALRQAPFSILGLAPPFPNPVGLSSFGSVNGQIASVGLQYGASGPTPTPLVTVSTEVSADRGPVPVTDVLQNLLSEHEDVNHPSPPGGRDPEAAEIPIDGVPRRFRVLDSGRAWAAVAELNLDDVALLVTIAARNWPLAEVALTHVTDLEPFFAARRQRVEAAMARAGSQPGPEDWDLPPAVGLSAHQALADRMIAITRERMAAGFPFHGSLGSDYARLWEAATRAQMELAGQGRDDAEDAIHSAINHLCQLVQSANWFGDSDLARDATAETLDHVAYRRDGPSAEAQRAWSRYWDLHGQQPPAFESLSSAQESWLAAWQRWVDRRQVT
jgi:hypothetical protein